MECEAAAAGTDKRGQGDKMSRVRVPELFEVRSGQGGGRRGYGRRSVGTEVGRRRRRRRQQTRDGQRYRLQSLRGGQAQERARSTAGIGAERAWRSRRVPVLLDAGLPSLVFPDVAAVDEGVGGGEGAAGAPQLVAWCMFEPLVQVQVVLALAAVGAAVAVKGALARVHAPVLDQLVGRLGQVAALLAAVVVAQAVGAHVPLQLGPARPRRLADAAAVLHLVVRLQVALHGRRPAG